MEELPMACSLEAAQLRERLAEIAALGEQALLGSESRDGRELLWFREAPEIRARLERVVEAERRCCAFLDLELAEDAGRLRLVIAAPPQGEPIAAGLAAAFRG